MQLKIGDKASLSKTISEQDVSDFARLSLDTNPLHLDEDYARQTRLRRTHRARHAGSQPDVSRDRYPAGRARST